MKSLKNIILLLEKNLNFNKKNIKLLVDEYISLYQDKNKK